MLISFPKRANPHKASAQRLYDAIVAQARQPGFYEDMAVPDTVDGRFDMILLHAFIVMLRLRDGGDASRELSQALYDVMFVDMDRAIREIGIGDLSVKKHIRRMMKAFNGRMDAYEIAIDDRDRLMDALRRNVYGTLDHDVARGILERMADYLQETVRSARMMPVEMMTVAAQMPWAAELKKTA